MKPRTDDHPGVRGTVMKRQQPALEIVRDVYAGTLRIREKAGTYLPQWPKEDETCYAARVNDAVLFNAFRRSAEGLAGMVYLNEPELSDDLDQVLRTDLLDVDLRGRDLAAFGAQHFTDAMVDGHAAIFVDMERIPEGSEPRNRREEIQMGLRPYWVSICKEDILRASVQRIRGRLMLTRIAWTERTVEADGDYADTEVERVRELTLTPAGVEWSLYRQAKKGDPSSWEQETGGTMPLPEIPVAVTYTGFVDDFESDPPLLDLAHENLKHMRKRSDLDNIEHVAAVPVLSLSGVSEGEFSSVSIGPSVGLKFSDPRSSASWAEISGSGMEQIRKSLSEIEHRMALLGLSMLMSESRSAETATSKRIDKSESDSALSKAARSHQVALNMALYYHAMWRGIGLDATQTWVTVNRDFEDPDMPPEVMRAYVEAVERAGLPVRVLLEVWQKSGRIPPDKNLDELELEMLAGAVAVEASEPSEVAA